MENAKMECHVGCPRSFQDERSCIVLVCLAGSGGTQRDKLHCSEVCLAGNGGTQREGN